MGHHVHRADAEHSPSHIKARKHVIHKVIFFDAIKEDFTMISFQIFPGFNQKTSCSACRVANYIIWFWFNHFNYHTNDVPRRTKGTGTTIDL